MQLDADGQDPGLERQRRFAVGGEEAAVGFQPAQPLAIGSVRCVQFQRTLQFSNGFVQFRHARALALLLLQGQRQVGMQHVVVGLGGDGFAIEVRRCSIVPVIVLDVAELVLVDVLVAFAFETAQAGQRPQRNLARLARLILIGQRGQFVQRRRVVGLERERAQERLLGVRKAAEFAQHIAAAHVDEALPFQMALQAALAPIQRRLPVALLRGSAGHAPIAVERSRRQLDHLAKGGLGARIE